MGSIIRWIGIGIGVLVLLLVAAVAIFAVTFDPNDLKGKLTVAVADQTGRELDIEGDIKLSFFPYVGFTLGPTRLSDAQGFGDQPFLAFDRAAASVRLLPLLTGGLEVGEVRLEGFALKAVTAASGANNWDDLTELGGDDTAPSTPSDAGSDFDLAKVSVGKVVLADAQLSYEDRASGTRYAITDWDLSTGAFRLGKPLDIETSLDLEAKNPDLAGQVTARGTVTPDEARTVLANPKITVSVAGAMLEALSTLDLEIEAERLSVDKAGPFDLTAPKIRAQAESNDFAEPLDARITATSLSGDLTAQTLALTALEANAWGMKMRGELQGRKILSSPELNGEIDIDTFSPKDVAAKAGAPLSPTVDAKALTRAALSGDFAITQTSARFSGVTFALDDTTFTGNLGVVDFERQALRFDLKGDELILDRYLSPASEQPTAQGPDDIALPAEDIRKADIDGKLAMDQLQLSGLTATDVNVTLKAAGGVLRIHPSTAAMYSGTYEGDIRIDASGEQPTLSLNERLSKVDFGALGADVFEQQNLMGQLDGRITLKGTGVTQSALLSTLNGDAQFSFLDGALIGIDIPHEVQKGLATFQLASAPEGAGDGRTEFAELSGTAKVTDGVMSNDDLIARLPFMLVNGKGTVNLVEDALKYRLDLQFQRSPELPDGAEKLLDRQIPVVMGGTLAKPGLDFSGTAEALARQALEKKAGKFLDRLTGGGDDAGGEGQSANDSGDADIKKVGKALGGLLRRRDDKQKDDSDNDR